jgi:hypothetical protein
MHLARSHRYAIAVVDCVVMVPLRSVPVEDVSSGMVNQGPFRHVSAPTRGRGHLRDVHL